MFKKWTCRTCWGVEAWFKVESSTSKGSVLMQHFLCISAFWTNYPENDIIFEIRAWHEFMKMNVRRIVHCSREDLRSWTSPVCVVYVLERSFIGWLFKEAFDCFADKFHENLITLFCKVHHWRSLGPQTRHACLSMLKYLILVFMRRPRSIKLKFVFFRMTLVPRDFRRHF